MIAACLAVDWCDTIRQAFALYADRAPVENNRDAFCILAMVGSAFAAQASTRGTKSGNLLMSPTGNTVAIGSAYFTLGIAVETPAVRAATVWTAFMALAR